MPRHRSAKRPNDGRLSWVRGVVCAWVCWLVCASSGPACWAQFAENPDFYELGHVSPPPVANTGWLSGIEILPTETLYPAYLAGPKESRLGTQIFNETDQGALWDTTLGGRFGWLRGRSDDGLRVWQVDVEGAAILRLDAEENIDLQAVDFRAGIPIAWAFGPHRLKLGYYHLSAHVGDEFLIKNPGFERLNYVRDAIVFGYARYLSDCIRVYAEASWAFYHDVGDPWNVQLGFEHAPTGATGPRGAPFFAINALLREEVDFGGTTTVHAGWAWREGKAGRMLRTGLFFQTGKTHFYEFFDTSETHLGAGIWYDF